MYVLNQPKFSLGFMLCFSAFMLAAQPVLMGTADGLYRLEAVGKTVSLLRDVEIRKIVKAGDAWFFLGSRGILYSRDLVAFEERNAGLPDKTIKTYVNGAKGFLKEIQELKDLEFDPYAPATMVTCTKDEVFVTRDGGKSWKAYPTPYPAPGLKAVAITSVPELLVFASHSIKGPFVRALAGEKNAWREIGGDLGKSCPTTSSDEISDIVVDARPEGPVIWAANSFLPRIYKYDVAGRVFKLAYRQDAAFGAFDSLMPRKDGLLFVTDGTVMKLADDGTAGKASQETVAVNMAASLFPVQLNALWSDASNLPSLNLSELWLVSFKSGKPYRAAADGKNGFYLQTGFMVHADSRARFDKVMTERNLDMVTVDLKDDVGQLRFTPRDPAIAAIGRTVSPLDIEGFVREMKAKNRYLVARIVVFKDKRLFEYSGGKYAIWDSSAKAPWRGYRTVKKDAVPAAPAPAAGTPGKPAAVTAAPVYEREYYGEYWIDPYSEKVWEYNVAIAREIIARGFDEVQFDYIRFPTDGENLGDASYRWKDAGMDKESALMSFLNYARANIAAPISIDIYGANGWYRSGVRTGQDVELLSRYVDVICPMFYPSHFEQDFMAFAPAEQRPYRIYQLGTLRNSYIGRKKVVIRPYLQAFFLNVRYDREFYSPKYVSLQVDGIRDSSNEGLTFWNNSGRYDDIPVLQTRPDGKLAGGLN